MKIVTGEINTTDIFDLYMRDIRSIKRLPAEELPSLHRAYKAGDASARETLWKEAMRLVVFAGNKIMRRSTTGRMLSLDAMQDGMVAVAKAIDTWDPAKGTFATWIVAQVRGVMLDSAAKSLRRGIGSKSAPILTTVLLDDDVGVIDDHAETDMPGEEEHDTSRAHDAMDIGGYRSPEHSAYLCQVREAVNAIEDEDVRFVLINYYGLDDIQLTLQEIACSRGRAVSWVHGKLKQGHRLVEKTLITNSDA